MTDSFNQIKIHSFLKSLSLNYLKRRESLLEEMKELGRSNIDCLKCVGTCCTFEANSMQISPVEALDILFFLIKEGRLNEKILQRLKKSIRDYRLDQVVGDGKRNFNRKRYTCPFYSGNVLGCQVNSEFKPYGCLGFNPIRQRIKKGEGCRSYTSWLEKNELKNESIEKELAHYLEKKLNIKWQKLPIPVAVIKMAKAIESGF